MINVKEAQRQEVVVDILPQEFQEQVQLISADAQDAFRYRKYSEKLHQFKEVSSMHNKLRQQITNYLNVVLGESNHPKEVDQIIDLVNDAISVQALLHQTENTLIDLIIKEDLKFRINFSATLDPVVNQNILVQNTQS